MRKDVIAIALEKDSGQARLLVSHKHWTSKKLCCVLRNRSAFLA